MIDGGNGWQSRLADMWREVHRKSEEIAEEVVERRLRGVVAGGKVQGGNVSGSVPQADNATTAVDADTLDGLDSTDFASAGHAHSLDALSDVTITSAITGQALVYDGTAWVNGSGGGGSGGHTIQDEGVSLPDQPTLNFTGAGVTVTDDATNNKTMVSIPGGGGGSSSGQGCRASRTTSQAIQDASWTSVMLDSEAFDTDGFHSTATNNSRMTIPTGLGGIYALTAHVEFDTWPSGVYFGRFLLNGTTRIGEVSSPTADPFPTKINWSTIYQLTDGDYVEMQVFQSSGVSLGVMQKSEWSPIFSLVRLG